MNEREEALILSAAEKLNKRSTVSIALLSILDIFAIILFVLSLVVKNLGLIILSFVIIILASSLIVFLLKVRRNPMKYKKHFIALQTKEERNMPNGSIDRVDWHYETAEKEYKEKDSITGDLTPEQISAVALLAANHIGVFLQWIIDRGFEGEDADSEGCKKVRDREITGSEYLIQYCDGKLWWTDICENLHPFVEEYYYDSESGKYLHDYGEYCLPTPDSCYHVISTEEDYKRLKERLDMVYEDCLNKHHNN